jgi:signal transduction histidine kinase
MQERSLEDLLHDMRQDLHDLCQPLTALQCRLEMAKMHDEPELLRDVLKDSLGETYRMFAAIALMRERLLSEQERQQLQAAKTEVSDKEKSNQDEA